MKLFVDAPHDAFRARDHFDRGLHNSGKVAAPLRIDEVERRANIDFDPHLRLQMKSGVLRLLLGDLRLVRGDCLLGLCACLLPVCAERIMVDGHERHVVQVRLMIYREQGVIRPDKRPSGTFRSLRVGHVMVAVPGFPCSWHSRPLSVFRRYFPCPKAALVWDSNLAPCCR
jgi:hypothetical protein